MKITLWTATFALLLVQKHVEGNVITQSISGNSTKLEDDLFVILDPGFYHTAQEAVHMCNDLGMKLISIPNEEKQDLVASFLSQTGSTGRFWTSGIRYYWSTFLWSGIGQLFTYKKWNTHEQEPNLPVTSSSVCMFLGQDLYWYDDECYNHKSVMCEK